MLVSASGLLRGSAKAAAASGNGGDEAFPNAAREASVGRRETAAWCSVRTVDGHVGGGDLTSRPPSPALIAGLKSCCIRFEAVALAFALSVWMRCSSCAKAFGWLRGGRVVISGCVVFVSVKGDACDFCSGGGRRLATRNPTPNEGADPQLCVALLTVDDIGEKQSLASSLFAARSGCVSAADAAADAERAPSSR